MHKSSPPSASPISTYDGSSIHLKTKDTSLSLLPGAYYNVGTLNLGLSFIIVPPRPEDYVKYRLVEWNNKVVLVLHPIYLGNHFHHHLAPWPGLLPTAPPVDLVNTWSSFTSHLSTALSGNLHYDPNWARSLLDAIRGLLIEHFFLYLLTTLLPWVWPWSKSPSSLPFHQNSELTQKSNKCRIIYLVQRILGE